MSDSKFFGTKDAVELRVLKALYREWQQYKNNTKRPSKPSS